MISSKVRADKNRPNSRQRGYTRRWEKARLAYLREHPLCVLCQAIGRTTQATVVDHKTPHHGDPAIFWDVSQWQSVCQPCHDSVKQAQERTGWLRGADKDGVPLDVGHHWHSGPKP
jgi:5-methylcytosine-specific restriction endonuclease McrA